MIRCFVSDLDGTLLNDCDSLAFESAAVIQQSIQKGYEFIIASGRSRQSVEKLLKPYDIHCLRILCNGALIVDADDHILYTRAIDEVRIKAMASILEQLHFDIQLYTSKGHAARNSQAIFQRFVEITEKKRKLTEKQAQTYIKEHFYFEYEEHITDWNSYLSDAPLIYKLEAYCDDEESLHQAVEELKKIDDIDVNIVHLGLEITDIQAQKGIALDWLMQKMKFTNEEAAVFGDGMNDRMMFERYPNSFAPQNASADIKKLAAHIIGSHKDQSVAKTIQRLIELQSEL